MGVGLYDDTTLPCESRTCSRRWGRHDHPPVGDAGRHQGVLQGGGGVVVLADGTLTEQRLTIRRRLEKVDGLTLGRSSLGTYCDAAP